MAAILALASVMVAPAQPVRAADIGYRDFSYSAAGVSAPTGQKPQSKLWFAHGSWWGALYSISASGYTVQQLDWATQRWQDTGVLVEPRHSSYLDVLFDGSHVYVAGAGTSPTTSTDSLQIRRLSYDLATGRWSVDPGYPVTIVNGGMEAAVIDKDSTGKVWATWTRGNAVYVSHTTTDDRTWTTPFIIPATGSANLTPDDISAVVSFDGKIGVMWSNANDWAMYFAIHVDGDPDGAWVQNPAIQGPEYADDHMNLKSLQADTEGRVYAVTKTSLNASSAPLMLVSVLDRHGSWSRTTFGTVADNHTRPLLLIDQQNKQLYVFAASPCCSGGTIYYKQSPLDNPSFPPGLGTPFIQSSLDTTINNPASTKQALDGTSGLVVIAGDDHSKFYLHNAISLGTDSTPPDTTITSAPADGTTVAEATFGFAATETGSTFECRMDAGAWNGCTSPTSYPGLADGSHTFEVRGTDTAGNTDPTPATWTWTVAPGGDSGTTVLNPTADTFVDQRYPTAGNGSATTLESDAGTGVEKDALLRFDTTTVPGSVSSATLRVYVTNSTGNGPPVYPTAPTWDESTVNWNTKPAVTGAGVADAGAMPLGAWYEYDVTPLVAPGTQVSLALLPQSTDAVKFDSREGLNPPQLVVDWTNGGGGADTTPPETTIDSGPSGTTSATDATFTFSSSEAGSTFECRLDAASWASCTSPAGQTGLPEGKHTFDVRATDQAGNTDPTPASRTWTVDLTAPSVVSVSPADAATDVAVDATVTAQLSEAMDPATVTGSTFTLVPSGGTPVSASVTWSGSTMSARLVPQMPLEASTLYTARVTGMTDLAGNPVSAASWSFTTAAPPAGATLHPVADAYVDERKPTRNFGTGTALTSDYAVGAAKEVLLKFEVNGIPAPITRATLRLWVTNGSSNGPELDRADSDTWSEATVTWATRPGAGVVLGDAGIVPTGTWYEYDVAAVITADGAYAFRLWSTSTDATTFASRESSTPPELVLEWQAP